MPLLRRRGFLSSLLGMPAVLSAIGSPAQFTGPFQVLKTSLNAFSFNRALLEGTMTVFDLLDYCSATGFEGVDITGYYLKGYPEPPPDEYLYEVKRKAFDFGLNISGTGVRNDFTIPDKTRREKEVELV